MSAKERWIRFFKYMHSKNNLKVVKDIIENERGIAMATQVLQRVSKDDAVRFQALSDEKRLTDWWRDLESHKEEARDEGRVEGIIETAKNFARMGLSLKQISEGTGLSTEEINKIIEELAYN